MNMFKAECRNKAGFSLIETLLVLALPMGLPMVGLLLIVVSQVVIWG